MQVNCNPPGNISVKVIDSRVDGGSYIALVLLDVSLPQALENNLEASSIEI